MSTVGCNGGFEVKNTGPCCVGTGGTTPSSFHPSYSGSHWTPHPENNTCIDRQTVIHTRTPTHTRSHSGKQTLSSQGHWDGITLHTEKYNTIFISIQPTTPERENRLKGVYISKDCGGWVILEININQINMASKWVGLRETGRKAGRVRTV